jgi:UDP-N-acetylglucosamine 2-epimerase
MYESHFGLSGPPFQLNPDPAFYYDSRGHSNALAYLKFGAHQGEGFIVVTGEIGAGKTTLVRTLLDGLDASKVVAAQVVSTQLESGDLLRAILAAFGVPATGASKAHLIASLEGFLTSLAAQGRRALLIVDEAQNLKHEAVEELRMLSNFQLGNHALLQSFLIGQPELRTLLQSKSMEQLRQRVIASCHLGPLSEAETRAYIEHRLHRVGWQDTPHFADDAFDQIHRWTGGVPRRINRLCNRLFLAAFLSGNEEISAAIVDQTAAELRSEIGELADVPLQSNVSNLVVAPMVKQGAGLADGPAAGGDGAGMGVVRRIRSATPLQSPILCLVDNRTDYLKAGALARVLKDVPDLPPVMVVHPGDEASLFVGALGTSGLPLPGADVHLGAATGDLAQSAGPVISRFDRVLSEFKPSAVLCMGKSDGVLLCGLLAHKRRVPLLRLDAGQRAAARDGSAEVNGVLIDRLADALYTAKLQTYYTLYREGIPADRVHCVGNLVADLLHFALPNVVSPAETLKRARVPSGCLSDEKGFALLSLDPRAQPLDEVLPLLGALGRELPLVWPLREEALLTLKMSGQDERLVDARVTLIASQGYLEELGLLQSARCLITGAEGEFLEEALSLGVRSVTLAHDTAAPAITEGSNTFVGRNVEQALAAVRDVLQSPTGRSDVPEYWDGGTANRIAKHLRSWLPQLQRVHGHALGAETA